MADVTSPPDVPTIGSATGTTPGEIDVTWTTSGTSQTGFRIQRTASSGTGSFADIGFVASGGSYTFADTGLVSGGTYAYRLIAVNDSTGVISDPSSSVSGSTTTPTSGASAAKPTASIEASHPRITTAGNPAQLTVYCSGDLGATTPVWYKLLESNLDGSNSAALSSSDFSSPTVDSIYTSYYKAEFVSGSHSQQIALTPDDTALQSWVDGLKVHGTIENSPSGPTPYLIGAMAADAKQPYSLTTRRGSVAIDHAGGMDADYVQAQKDGVPVKNKTIKVKGTLPTGITIKFGKPDTDGWIEVRVTSAGSVTAGGYTVHLNGLAQTRAYQN